MNEDSEFKAAEIRAQLRIAGELVPASLRDEAYGTADDVDAPYLVVESAEGVTTFPGIQEGNGERESAAKWFEARHDEIRKAIPQGGAKPNRRRGRLPFSSR